MRENAPQLTYPLSEVFDGLHWIARAVSSRRMIPHDRPPLPRSTTRRNAGWRPASSGILPTTFAGCCTLVRAAYRNSWRLFWTAAPYTQAPRA